MNKNENNHIEELRSLFQNPVWNQEKIEDLESLIKSITIRADEKVIYKTIEIISKRGSDRLSNKIINNLINACKNINNEVFIFNAAFFNNSSFIESLCLHGANPNLTKGYYKETPLMTASKASSWQSCEVLLKFGAKINATDRDGKNAYTYAMEKGNTETAKRLVQQGVKPIMVR